jgi:predicted nucleotidyltransferase
MNQLVDQHKEAVAEICQRFGVKRLYLFGSAETGRFDPRSSDLDFLVTMEDRRPTGAYADRVLDFADALEQLFGRHVDLLTEESIRNPYLRSEVEATRQLVYGRADQEAAA